MSLINCPECGKQISDKAISCPNCGYPINNKIEKDDCKYDIVLTKLLDNCDKIKLIGTIRGIKGWGLADTKEAIDNPPVIVFNDMDYDSAVSAQKMLLKCSAESEIVKAKKQSDVQTKENEVFKNYNSSTIICPCCGSSAVTTGQKGFSLFTGFLGSNKTVNRCGNCGHTWSPRN